MEDIKDLHTVEEVDERIEEIGRNMKGLEQYARSRAWTPAERAADPKLGAMCEALERRAEIESADCHQRCGPSFRAHH